MKFVIVVVMIICLSVLFVISNYGVSFDDPRDFAFVSESVFNFWKQFFHNAELSGRYILDLEW